MQPLIAWNEKEKIYCIVDNDYSQPDVSQEEQKKFVEKGTRHRIPKTPIKIQEFVIRHGKLMKKKEKS